MKAHELQPVAAMFLLQLAACGPSSDTNASHQGEPYIVTGGSQNDSGTAAKDGGSGLADSAKADGTKADAAQSDSAMKDAAAEPEAPAPSCPGIQTLISGTCACPTNMDPKGAACVESFDHASKPADGWVWTKAGNETVGCSSSDTAEGCNGTDSWSDPACNYTIGGNVGWAIVDSPFSAGGKALREYSYANNGCCWQGDSIQKTYSLGKSYRIDELELSLRASASGSGAAWQCGFIAVSLNSEGDPAGSVQYDDPVHGSQNGCGYGKPLPLQHDGTVVFDLAQDFAGLKDATFDGITIKVYAYSCEPGVSHDVTIDDVTIGLKP